MDRATTPRDRPAGLPGFPPAMRPATVIAAFVALYLFLDWLSFVHAVDTYWLLVPFFRPRLALAWQDIPAFIALPCLTLAFVLYRLRGVPAGPAGDPYLAESVALHG